MPDTQNMFDPATIATILKWAVIVLITGFIAQFGKQFAAFLTGKIRNIRRKKAGGSPAGSTPASTPAPADTGERARLKLEKKLAKAAAKKMKKGL